MEAPGSPGDGRHRQAEQLAATTNAARQTPWHAVFGWLGVIAILVAAGLAGRGIAEPTPRPEPSASLPPSPTPRIELFAPRPGSQWVSNGWMQVTGRTTGGGDLDVSLSASGIEIGGLSLVPDARGDFAATFPILPPIDGGSVTMSVHALSGSTLAEAVTFTLMPAPPLLIWDPKAFSVVEGDVVSIAAATLPEIDRVHLTLKRPDGTVILDADATPSEEPPDGATSLTEEWRSLRTELSLPAEHQSGCVVLVSKAFGAPANFTIETIFSFLGPDPTPRCLAVT